MPLDPDKPYYASGANIVRFPAGGHLHGWQLADKATEGNTPLMTRMFPLDLLDLLFLTNLCHACHLAAGCFTESRGPKASSCDMVSQWEAAQ